MGTAAELFGFGTEVTQGLHIHDPGAKHVHGYRGVVAHQRLGAPLTSLNGQLVTTAAWTAVELARSLAKPRAWATLDAALALGVCGPSDLTAAADAQVGRRGIVHVRSLIAVADGAAQSPMESECRLLFRDAGLPAPTLQHPVLDDFGMPRFFLDFAWEHAMVAGEYDGDEFHATPLAVRRDKARVAWLQERGWLVVPITADDVRRRQRDLIRRLQHHLITRAA
ncbi:endonuclease domain-containing protein [Antrihabitans cavernicola]|uniref:endonuclease domain-containing protein n=1 Tax=Antrihabitans cavernicola TaxID=2495913 RepID=UPI001F360948|nr:endonuclease domain-containing protein [Spelaeibacter cavernicola]